MKKSTNTNFGKSGKIGGSSGRIGTSGGKLGTTASKIGSSPKITMPSGDSHKKYGSPTYYKPRSGKSSSTFGIIWLPTRKRNKYKNEVFDSHTNDKSKERRPSMYGSMSGDSSSPQPYIDHKKEESSLLVQTNKASTSVDIAGASAVVTSDISSDKPVAEESQDLLNHSEESKEASGDGDKSNDDYLVNDGKVINNEPESLDQEKPGDNVDRVFIKSPPPHKSRSSPTAAEEEEDCEFR